VEACLQFVEASSPFRYCLIAVGDPQGVIVAHRLAERGRARGLAFIIGASIDFVTGKQRRARAGCNESVSNGCTACSAIRGDWRGDISSRPKFFAYVGRSKVVWRPTRPISE